MDGGQSTGAGYGGALRPVVSSFRQLADGAVGYTPAHAVAASPGTGRPAWSNNFSGTPASHRGTV
ncbi:hypothetical protein Sar04_45960 [Salinispora arenicola]|uniref:Uncharacterized protein n=1 Tax=Salinispora arenicola TaxID=168697 RepID=A0ABQ4JY49_SALAC|nr:hypothetical protein Sar04_45960 [Salinispora arenicola]